MTYDIGALAPAAHEYLTAMQAAADHDDPILSPHGLEEYRRAAMVRARDALAAALPTELPAPDRTPALDALWPHTADQVAVVGHEWSKVAALLESGKPLGGIIANASPARLAAILDATETMPEVLAEESGAIAAEIADAIFARLVALGDADAVRIAEEEAAVKPVLAARAFIEGTLANGSPTYEGMAAVHAVDPTTYRLIADGVERVDTGTIDRMTRRTSEAA